MRDSLHTRLKLFKKKTIGFACGREEKSFFFRFQLTNYQVDANTINNFLSTTMNIFHFTIAQRSFFKCRQVFKSIYRQQS
jgi:hypothetical protein